MLFQKHLWLILPTGDRRTNGFFVIQQHKRNVDIGTKTADCHLLQTTVSSLFNMNKCVVTVWNKLRIVSGPCPSRQQTHRALFLVSGSSACQRHSKAALLFKCQPDQKRQRKWSHGRTNKCLSRSFEKTIQELKHILTDGIHTFECIFYIFYLNINTICDFFHGLECVLLSHLIGLRCVKGELETCPGDSKTHSID